uniref:Extracellular serine-rich protein n=1 Tax=Mycena chlorophos TaxID=658473 RepID=A0ABQ0LB08_MYCCL|nr:predicted protein [Mycena chlorophos]
MLLPLLLAAFVLPVLAQVTHTVTVGVQGSFFDPPTVSANENDIILFVFGGDAHTVTQGSFEHPCVALPGGFDSGFQGRGPDFDAPTPVWSLTVSNTSEPIWFFCSATVPTSHCESGMVGVINPPSINMYAEFVSAAKAVTSTPQPSPSFMPSGQGAFATASPMLSSAPLSSVLSAFSAPTQAGSVLPTTASADQVAATTVAASPSGATSTRRANAGLIAGCVTAGALCVFVLLAVVYWYRIRKRSRGHRDPSEKPLGRDDALDPYMPSELPVGYDYRSRNASSKESRTRQMASYNTTTYDGSRAGGPSFVADERRHRDGTRTYPRPLPIPGVSSAAEPTTNHQQHPQVPLDRDTTGSPDITALAMEVASVLLHTPPKPKPPPATLNSVSGPRARSESRTRTWSRSGRRLSASLQNALVGTKSAPATSGTPTAIATASDTGTSRWYEAERESASDDGLDADLNASERASTSAAPPYSRYGE